MSRSATMNALRACNRFLVDAFTANRCDSVEAPQALAFALSTRASRHMRGARISWW